MSQGSFNPKIRFQGQKVCPVARVQTDGQTHTKVTTEGTLSGFQEFFLQPIIKDRPKNVFLSHAPPWTDGPTHRMTNEGFRVSWFFSFNLSSRIGPKKKLQTYTGAIFVHLTVWKYPLWNRECYWRCLLISCGDWWHGIRQKDRLTDRSVIRRSGRSISRSTDSL